MYKKLYLLFSFVLLLLSTHINAQTQLVQNGDFAVPCCVGISWTSSPDFYYNINYSSWHSSPGYAYLSASNGSPGNNLSGIIDQTLSSIPSNITSGTISFWYSITTSETSTTTVYDAMSIGLNSGSSSYNLKTVSNLNNTNGNYVYFSASLNSSAIAFLNANSNSHIRISGYTDGASPSTFRIDDVSLLVNAGSSSNFDLTTSNPSVSPTTVAQSGTINVSCRQNFSGTCGSNYLNPDPEVGYYLSSNTTFEQSLDTYIEDDPSNIGDGDAYDNESYNGWQIPATTPPGNYYILFVADYTNQHSENNENNNVSFTPITITGSNPCVGVNITQQPTPQSTTSGNTATFSVSATGTTPLSYQWKKNNVNISGATNAAYTTPTLSTSNNGESYRCAVTNCNGTVNSNAASLTVTSGCIGVNITQQPSNQNITSGSSATYSVSATGTAPITYQWQRNNVNISGATSATYTTPNLTTSNSGDNYRCRVTNCNGTVTSNNASVSVTTACTAVGISQQPQNKTANEGSSVTFSVTASGTGPFTYQWRRNGNTISGATNSTYQISNVTMAMDNDAYSCYITNCGGTKTKLSNSANLNVLSAPTVVVTYPNGGETFNVGDNINITAIVNGSITGQLIEYSNDGGNSWIIVNGSSTSSNTVSIPWQIPSVTSSTYKVRVTVYHSNGYVRDLSNASFNVISQNSGQGFDLNPNGISHLFWPFANSNWHSNENNIIRSGWKFTGGSKHGQGGHVGAAYYAEDWNRIILNDCNKKFESPIYGKVIFVREDPLSLCSCSYTSSGDSAVIANCGKGNTVIIQSLINPNFAFQILHLNDVFVSLGQTVNVGDDLGEVGSTGYSTSAHAHCALYKGILDPIPQGGNQSPTTAKIFLMAYGQLWSNSTPSYKDKFSAQFVFDATYNSGSGGQINSNILASNTVLCGNGDSCSLASPILGYRYFWNTGDTTQSIIVKNSGLYSLLVSDSLGNPILNSSIKVVNNDTSLVNIVLKPNSLCAGNTIQLYTNMNELNSHSGNVNNDNYLWSNGSKEPGITIFQAGTYSVQYTDPFGCATSSDTIVIDEKSNPVIPNIQANTNELATSLINGVQYQWYFGDDTITAAHSQFYTAIAEGYYSVEVTNQYGCKSISAPIYISKDVLEGILDLNTKIYPNPASDKLFVEANEPIQMKSIKVINSVGQLLLNHENTEGERVIEIDVSSLQPALYFIQIETEEEKVVKKLLVE